MFKDDLREMLAGKLDNIDIEPTISAITKLVEGLIGEKEIEEIVWKYHQYLCSTRLDIAKGWVKDIAKAITQEIRQRLGKEIK